jgi:hypothetical protein
MSVEADAVQLFCQKNINTAGRIPDLTELDRDARIQ